MKSCLLFKLCEAGTVGYAIGPGPEDPTHRLRVLEQRSMRDTADLVDV